MSGEHQAVLLDEVVSYLAGAAPRRLIDGTVGFGGHAAALLQALPEAELLGLDRDEEALQAAASVLQPFGARVHLRRAVYSRLAEVAGELGWTTVDAVLLDIGVSSWQIDAPARGFSFRHDGPLDMRMDRRDRVTAAVIVNTWPEAELARIFREYGEEPKARRVAQAIVARRAERPWLRTLELAETIAAVVGQRGGRSLPPATRCFQALRIAVNDELGELERGLAAAVELLAPGGRLGVIAFHSLEDRRVKHFLRYEALSCVCPPDCPLCVCGKVARLKLLTRKPVGAGAAELARNPRSAAAHLRVAERLAEVAPRGRGTAR